jgi:hypothetical protein
LANEISNHARPSIAVSAIQKTIAKPNDPNIEVIDQLAAAFAIQK